MSNRTQPGSLSRSLPPLPDLSQTALPRFSFYLAVPSDIILFTRRKSTPVPLFSYPADHSISPAVPCNPFHCYVFHYAFFALFNLPRSKCQSTPPTGVVAQFLSPYFFHFVLIVLVILWFIFLLPFWKGNPTLEMVSVSWFFVGPIRSYDYDICHTIAGQAQR